MSLWILNPPEPTAAPSEPQEIGVSPSDLFGADHRCGHCQCVPDAWLLTVPLAFIAIGAGDVAEFEGKPGQRQFVLKRRLWTENRDVSPYVQRCVWACDELVRGLEGVVFANYVYDMDVLNFGSRNYRFVLAYRGFNSVFGSPTWIVFDHGWVQTIIGGQTVLGARWLLGDEGQLNVAQDPGDPQVLHRSFDCLGPNRFFAFDVAAADRMRIEPFYGAQ